MRRRTFVGLTGASLFSAMLAGTSRGPRIDAEPFAPVLAGHIAGTAPGALEAPPDLSALTAAVNQARSQYQACHYTELIKYLPGLLARLHDTCLALDSDERLRAYTLSADAHHVAAGLLLKLDDQGLAYLAADRSMHAAQASQNPVTVGASARIITHTLMNGHHLAAAITTASTHAAALDRDIGAHTPESLSIYGSLLLRGAIAAAQHGKRDTAHELLTEAEDAAQRLGVDGNLRWTAFGPTNATLHRVNIAVRLGDAGTAIDVARRVDLRTITVPERKASLLIDTARAFLQWDKPDKAYIALRAAEETAHEEVAGRPSVHRVVRQLVTAAPPTLRRDAEQFAAPDRRRPMTSRDPLTPVLSIVVCGAGPATAIGTLVKLAHERGWIVQVIATPAALDFFDPAAIEAQTGSPVRSQYRKPGEPRSDIADAIIVAPATYNTINKWAHGISDTYALGVLAETTGLGVPIVVLPFVNSALASRPPFVRSVEALREECEYCSAPAASNRTRPAPRRPHRQLPLAVRPGRSRTHAQLYQARHGRRTAGSVRDGLPVHR